MRKNIILYNIGESKTPKIERNSSLACYLKLAPIWTIYVRSQPTIISIDTGLEVNYIPYKLIELLDLHNNTKATCAKCAGPNGEFLRTYGEIYI